MGRILFLVLFLSCNGTGEKKSESINAKGSALEHLRQAKEILRQEEGQLMIMGRGFSESEKIRYETLVDSGQKITQIIDLLEKTEI